tara:strand:- start:74 stop:277 length:204 start_codon:yes stop_codon:yes gene_type:complete
VVYKYEDYRYVHDYGKGTLYKGNHLVFTGNAWTGVLLFLDHTNNAPEVRQMFRNQLYQREKLKFQQD